MFNITLALYWEGAQEILLCVYVIDIHTLCVCVWITYILCVCDRQIYCICVWITYIHTYYVCVIYIHTMYCVYRCGCGNIHRESRGGHHAFCCIILHLIPLRLCLMMSLVVGYVQQASVILISPGLQHWSCWPLSDCAKLLSTWWGLNTGP